MKTLKFLLLLLWMLAFQTGAAQIDLFLDEDEVEEFNVNSEFIMDNYSFKEITDHLKKGGAGPIGNWAGESLEIMTDSRFADAPQEYLMAFQVRTKVLKVKALNAALEKLNLSCEERKQLIESYILFLGTLYLDMYSMDFFNEKNEYTVNEVINVMLGAGDAKIKFAFNRYDRSLVYLEDEEDNCLNDVLDPNITDCNHKIEEISGYNGEYINDMLELDDIHPIKVSKLLLDLQTMLDGLPCNKP